MRGPAVNAQGAVLSCRVPYGKGGLGQHFAQVVEDARRAGRLARYFCTGIRPGDEAVGVRTDGALAAWAGRWTPLRFSPGWRNLVEIDLFDRWVARSLRGAPRGDTFIGFVGQALHTFRQARSLGYRRLELVAANSHVRNVMAQHAKAIARYGIETSWLNPAQVRKTLREYELADVIQVASDYSLESFLEQGVPREKLVKVPLRVDPRFRPPAARTRDGVFRIVYVGSLTVMKGVPLLLEAFSRLPVREAELTLVGGWSTRGMRRYLQAWLQRDSRIRLAPGDPLPHLHRADVCVHPTYEDGFAYAPAEALACGIPVIVSEDTGMKEYVREGVNGYVVPTGDVDALVERLVHLYGHPLPRW